MYEPPNIDNPEETFSRGCDIQPTFTQCYVQINNNPFNEGAERYCFYGNQYPDEDLVADEKDKVVLKITKECNLFCLTIYWFRNSAIFK